MKKEISIEFNKNQKEIYKKGREDGYEYVCADISMIISCFEEPERLKKELIKYLNKINPLAVEFYLSEELGCYQK